MLAAPAPATRARSYDVLTDKTHYQVGRWIFGDDLSFDPFTQSQLTTDFDISVLKLEEMTQVKSLSVCVQFLAL